MPDIKLLNCEPKKYYKTIQVDRKQVRLHRYLMEQKIGRKLGYNEIVHHLDEDIWNNDLSNLEIVSRANHILIHPEIRAKSIEANTKYFIQKGLLYELFAVKRLTLKEISNETGLSETLLFYYIKKYGIARAVINCKCGKKLKYSKTMMCGNCRTKFNKRQKCQK